ARLPELLVALRADVELLPEPRADRIVPVVRIAYVDLRARRQPHVALLARGIRPELVRGGVGLDAAAERPLLPARIQARAAELTGQDRALRNGAVGGQDELVAAVPGMAVAGSARVAGGASVSTVAARAGTAARPGAAARAGVATGRTAAAAGSAATAASTRSAARVRSSARAARAGARAGAARARAARSAGSRRSAAGASGARASCSRVGARLSGVAREREERRAEHEHVRRFPRDDPLTREHGTTERGHGAGTILRSAFPLAGM